MVGLHSATAVAPAQQPPRGRWVKARLRVKAWLLKVFELNMAGLNWPRGVLLLDAMLVPLVVLWSIGHELYLLSAIFGLLFSAIIDPGGSYGNRAWRTAVFGLIGAGVTSLGFFVGGYAWGWLVLAASGVTLISGLLLMFGVRRFVAAFLLNIWFVVTVAFEFALHPHSHITNYNWAQTSAWAGGVAVWIVVTFLAWLVSGRKDQPPPFPEVPGDMARRGLTAPLITYAVLRALVIAGTTALAFGLNLSHGYWLPIAAIIAMKPTLFQSTIFAAQRLAGALIGAGAAALLMLIPANETGVKLFQISHGLEVVAIVLLMHGIVVRGWNYAFYCAFIAAAVLILVDLPQPSNFGAEGWRILWTLAGVGIGVFVMLLAALLGQRRAHATSK